MRYVYILQCADNSYYTWITLDLERRLLEHNTSPVGAKYTKSRRPVCLVRNETLESRSEAAKKELYIKTLSKQNKQKLINKP